MNQASAVARLRTATHNAHASVEATPLMQRLMAPDCSLPEYVGLLGRFCTVYGTLEPALQQGPEAARLGYAPRQALFVQALQALQADSPAPETGWIGPRTDHRMDRAAARWGCLYVVEGSALGGQLIHRHLRQCLPPCPPQALAPWLPYADAGRQWAVLRQHLEPALAAPQALDEAIETAVAVFGVFQEALGGGP